MDIAFGETLFGDFTVTLGFDNDPAAAVKPLTLIHWSCVHCTDRGDAHGPTAAVAGMVEHARVHFPVEVASRVGE